MNVFTIKDLENLSGVKAHTIRIWEQRYSFLKPQRTDTNIRYYNNDELKNLLNISLLNKYGFKISQIDKMSSEEIQNKILMLSQTEAQHERIINELIQCLIDLNILEFELTLNDFILNKGIERAILQIIFPFLERIGILWAANHISPAQEHLVSNIIRQKLIVGIEKVSHAIGSKTVLLFLPENEHHEIGLLFLNFLLRKKDTNTLYVGANVPSKDIEYIVKFKKPELLFCHLTSIAHNFNFEKFLSNIHLRLPGVPVIISGPLTLSYKKRIPSNIIFKKSLAEVLEFINSL